MTAHTCSLSERQVIEPRIAEFLRSQKETAALQSIVFDMLALIYPTWDASQCEYRDGVIVDNRDLDADPTPRNNEIVELSGDD